MNPFILNIDRCLYKAKNEEVDPAKSSREVEYLAHMRPRTS